MRVAEAGIAELKRHVDTLLVIPNQNLFRLATDRTTFQEAFLQADQVLFSGIACIVDLIVKEGLINLDLADVKTVLSGMGTAMMGTGEASGEHRAIMAAEEAVVNPLLDEVTLKGAKSLLLSITGGPDLTLWEVDEVANRVRQEVDPEANIIVGATFDQSLSDRVRVSIVASGMSRHGAQHPRAPGPAARDPPAARDAEPRGRGLRRAAALARSSTGLRPWRGMRPAVPIPLSVADRPGRPLGGVYIHEGPPQPWRCSPLGRPTRIVRATGKIRCPIRNSGAADDQRRGFPGQGRASSMLRSAQAYWAKGDKGHTVPSADVQHGIPTAPADDSERPSLLRRLATAGSRQTWRIRGACRGWSALSRRGKMTM